MESPMTGLALPRWMLLIAASGLWAHAVACSGAGDVANLISGASATLADTKTTVHIPSGGFDTDVTVALSENKVDTKGITNDQVISIPATLEFSNARVVQSEDPVSVTLQLDSAQMQKAIANGQGIYAMVRVRGYQISYDSRIVDEDIWTPLLGVLDVDAATLTIRLYASAGAIDVVGVAGSHLKVVAMDANAFGRSKAFKKAKSKSVTKAVNTVAMGQYPWAVVCDTDKLSDHGVLTCDANNPNSLVRKVQDGMTTASTDLVSHLGMDAHVIQQLTALSLGQTNLSTLPDPAVLRRHDPSVKYNMVYLTTGVSSTFASATGILKLIETQVGNDRYTNGAGSIFHHELVHAVQSVVCDGCDSFDDRVNLNRNSPLIEGTATAVGMLAAVNWNNDAVKGKLLFGVPRNWILTLAHYDPYNDSYYMTEFFTLANNGNLNYLMPLFRSFNGNDNGVFNRRLDAAVNASLGQSLADVYMKRVMPQRNSSSPTGIYYNVQNITNNDIPHRWNNNVAAMGTQQYLLTVDGNEDVCIQVRLEGEVDGNLALVALDGTSGGSIFAYGADSIAHYTTAGETLTIQANSADIQVVNISAGGVADSRNYTLEAHTDGACLAPPPPPICNPRKVVCGAQGCGLYIQDFGGNCWVKAIGCDARGRCTRRGFDGGFDFANCDNLRNQLTTNIPVGDDRREEPANIPDNGRCGDADLCQWMVLCPRW